MPTWDEQLARYFLQTTTLGGDSPSTSEGNQVTHLIDGHDYFGAIKLEIEILALTSSGSDPFFYIIGWWLGLVDAPDQWLTNPSVVSAWRLEAPSIGNAFRLDDGSGGAAPLMIDKLEEMADAGVDVRVLGWASPLILNHEAAAGRVTGHFGININTIHSVQEVRRRIGPGSATLMTLGHPLGAMHLKTIVAGTSNGIRAYVSGLDVQESRIAGNEHFVDGFAIPPVNQNWHDAGVQIVGPAAKTIYSFYRNLWNEQIDRRPDRFRLNSLDVVPSHFTTQFPSTDPPGITSPVSDREPVPSVGGPHVVQVLRTIPQMHMLFSNPATMASDFLERALVLGTARAPFSFAQDGIFEFGAALRHAISGAEKYIYIEDQAFWGIEIMEWMNAQLKAVPDLKIILVWGRDPMDPPSGFPHQAISNTLISGVSGADSRVGFFLRDGIIVHSKVTIIDDQWAAVGSANCMRRSLYTDGELSVSVMEDSPTPFAQVLRKDLWGELCGLAAGSDRDPLLDLDSALAVIDPTWSTLSPPVGIRLTGNIFRMKLPFEYANPPGPGQWPGTGPPSFDQFDYDVRDTDSR